jgi:RNA polymerase sigma factor (sigma-70 family)
MLDFDLSKLGADGGTFADDEVDTAETGGRRAPGGGKAQPAARGRDAADQGVLDVYRITLGQTALLTAEDEIELANAMRESRAHLVERIACIPVALEHFGDALLAAVAGDRRMSEVLHSPFADYERKSRDDDGPGGGRTIRTAAANYAALRATWKTARSRRRGAATARRALVAEFVRLDPGLQFLWEVLEHCTGLAEAGKDGGGQGFLEHLAAATRAGHRYRQAHKRMVEANLRLAYSVAQKFIGNGVEMEDLVQAANMGVIRAAEKFNPDLGYKFSTYAYQWIRQALSKALADTSRTIRVAAHVHDSVVRLRQTGRRLEQTLGRAPTIEELAEETGFDVERIVRAQRAGQRTLSLDSPVPELDDVSYADLVADPGAEPSEAVAESDLESNVRALMDKLPKREIADPDLLAALAH